MEKQTGSPNPPLPTQEDIKELIEFLPRLYQEGFQPVERWEGGAAREDGTLHLPYPQYDPVVTDFFFIAAKGVWMDFSYQPDEAWKMLADHDLVAQASLAQIKTMLTFCVRGERFADGHWASMIEQGHLRRLLERLSVLQDAMDQSSTD